MGSLFCPECGTKIDDSGNVIANGFIADKSKEDSKPLNEQVEFGPDSKKDHPYRHLGGFLSLIVYGGYVAAILMLAYSVLASASVFIAKSNLNSITNQLNSVTNSIGTYSSSVTSVANSANNIMFEVEGLMTFAALFVVAIGLIYCVFQIVFSSNIKDKKSESLNTFYWLLIVLCVAVVVYCIVLFAFVTDIDKKYLSSIGSSSYRPYSYSDSIAGYSIGNIIVYLIAGLVSVFASGVLATIYFTKSVRLRTYMGSDKYLRKCFVTSNMRGPEPAIEDEITDDDNEEDKEDNEEDDVDNELSHPDVSFCSSCGSKIPNNALFCRYCGKRK